MFLTKDNRLKWNWLVVAFVVTMVLCFAGIIWFDKPLYTFLRQFNWSVWVFFDTVFATKVWLVISFVFAALFLARNMLKAKVNRKKESKKFNFKRFLVGFIEKSKDNYGFLIFSSVFLASLVAGVLKLVLGRARPIFFEALNQTGFFPFTADWVFNSMPSGHTTASFAGLVMIGMLVPKIKWATWTLATVIGMSRVCYGAHWPTDVILGAFIGMVSADVVHRFLVSDKAKK